MPGSRNCARCGALVELAALAIDVNPPRASAWTKRVRRTVPYHRALPTLRAAVEQFFASLRLSSPHMRLSFWDSWRLIVPGWTQIRLGNPTRGRAFLVSFLMVGAVALLFPGTTLGAFALGTALAIHFSSILDIVFEFTDELQDRIIYTGFYSLLVGAVVYYPLSVVGSGLAAPRRIVLEQAPLLPGDVVLVSSWLQAISRPAPGDLVLYDLPPLQFAGRTGAWQQANYNLRGERISRVLAGPGQRVQASSEGLRIDGTAVDEHSNMPVAEKLDLVLPADHYLIVPAGLPLPPEGLRGEQWKRLSVVPADQILGRVYARTFPPWRLSLAL